MNEIPRQANILTPLQVLELKLAVEKLDNDFAVLGLTSHCSLDTHPGYKNWVDKNGGLPKYIHDIACELVTTQGFTISHAIATAVSRIKVWIASPSTHPDTKAKASAALSEWEAMRARAHAKSTAK